MRIDFEYLYGDTPNICKTCLTDCSVCIYCGDIFVLAEIDRLNAEKKLREQAIQHHTRELKRIEEQIERYKQKTAYRAGEAVIDYD